MPLSQPHSLTWGDIDLSTEADTGQSWRIEMLAVPKYGNPKPIIDAVESLLVDGDLAVINRWGNRELVVDVRICGDDGIALAQAEAALMAAATAERPDPLSWTPPALDGATAVFEVVTCTIERGYGENWDHDESKRLHRYFTLTFECLPWVRDADLTTIPAIPAPTSPSTPAVYETISSISGVGDWSPLPCHAAHFGTVTEDSGTLGSNTWYRVYASNTLTAGTVFLQAERATSTSLAGFPYLTVDAELSSQAAGGPAPYLRIAVGTTEYDPVAIAPIPEGFRYYFTGTPDTIANLKVRGYWQVEALRTTRRLRIFEIGRTDRIEVDGSSGLQVARTAVVGGSAPTQAAISLDAEAMPLLGSTALIYTGRTPVAPLRPFRISSSAVTTDTAMISGAKHTLAAPTVYRIPVARLVDAQYALLARLNFTGSKIIAWQARIVAADGTDIPGSDLIASGSTQLTNATTDPWMIHTLATLPLPPVAIDDAASTHAVEITLSMASGGSAVTVDEVWPLDSDNGDWTVIHEPSAFQLTRIECRSPQIDAPRPAVIGTWDGYGSQDITRLTVPGTHLLRPGLLHVFTATDMAKYAECAITYYRRHGWHPGPDATDAT
ncbi:hypothetical protein [Nocardioides sp.]|uniref:hypothetical protein n=1 Tax=Nocardioides sp. TaxID=35761 RepID=UPI0035119E24